jgi:hypothetical protein
VRQQSCVWQPSVEAEELRILDTYSGKQNLMASDIVICRAHLG